jgi:hypothetical protein
MVQAKKTQAGDYRAAQPGRVGEASGLLASLRKRINPQDILLVGFDFPIGLPLLYARRAGIDDFLAWLPQAGRDEWADFFTPAQFPEEICIKQPFYPLKPGAARQSHLISGLGLRSIDELRRKCELPQPCRRAAAPLFWTLGGQQVGKAAISGWKEVLQPALLGINELSLSNVYFWPFSGGIESLLVPGATILVESYPAEYYRRLGLSFNPPHRAVSHTPGEKRFGKRSQAARKANAGRLFGWTAANELQLDPGLQDGIQDGFGCAPVGEDMFDAAVGLFGMLDAILHPSRFHEPAAEEIRRIEGWIFGQVLIDP